MIIRKLLFFFLLCSLSLMAFFFGSRTQRQPEDFPLKEQKQFAVILYAHNCVNFCDRMLRSVFEQEYDRYRILFIDDASVDGTYEQAQRFCVEQDQEERVVIMKNEVFSGPYQSLLRGIEQCSEHEIVLPLGGWLAHNQALSRFNRAFQNCDVWAVSSQLMDYPSYKILELREGEAFFPPLCFYAVIFRSLPLTESYLETLLERSKGHFRTIEEPLLFVNQAHQMRFFNFDKESGPPKSILPRKVREFFK